MFKVRTMPARTSRRLRERRALYFAFMNCHGCTMSNDIFSSALAASGSFGWEEIQRARRCCWTCTQHQFVWLSCRLHHISSPEYDYVWPAMPELASNSERAQERPATSH